MSNYKAKKKLFKKHEEEAIDDEKKTKKTRYVYSALWVYNCYDDDFWKKRGRIKSPVDHVTNFFINKYRSQY